MNQRFKYFSTAAILFTGAAMTQGPDRLTAKTLGASLQPQSAVADQSILSNLFKGNTGHRTLYVQSGSWPAPSFLPDNNTASQGSTRFVVSDEGLNNVPQFVYTPSDTSDHSIYVPFFGDGITAMGLNTLETGGLSLSRVDRNNTYGTYRPVAQITNIADGPVDVGDDAIAGSRSLQVNGIYTKNWASAGKSGAGTLNVDAYAEGDQGFGAFIVGNYNRFHEYGQHWAWNQVNEMNDFSSSYRCISQDAASLACLHYNTEFNQGGSGPDKPASVYDPTQHTRQNVWITTNDYIKPHTWAASHAYQPHDLIQVMNPADGWWWMYEAGNSGGKSGISTPNWTYDGMTSVTDGAVQWQPLGVYTFDVGSALGFGGTGHSRFGTLIYADTSVNVYNALVDWSKASFDPKVPIKVWTRTQADTYLDLTADGTLSGQNQHVLGYSSAAKQLAYNMAGSGTLFSVTDSGAMTNIGIATLGTGGQSTLSTSQTYSLVGATVGTNLWNPGNNDADILGSEGGLMLGAVKRQNGHPNVTPALEIQNNNHVVFHSVAQLAAMTRSAVLALASPQEGQKVYDTDDHVEVTYRCPASASCAWFPTLYGTALSN
ncbi:hypothetical protein AA18889_1456 [Acetobacter senegalensis DSM 18889]|nr:hypothetical protein AA18889_1456 [Acetobacter senegalensis DSM 18889]